MFMQTYPKKHDFLFIHFNTYVNQAYTGSGYRNISLVRFVIAGQVIPP